jgi:hypothetical protein
MPIGCAIAPRICVACWNGVDPRRAALARILVGTLDAEPVVCGWAPCYRVTGRINVARLLPDAMIAQSQANSPFVVAPRGFGRQTCFPSYRSKGQ